MGGIVRIIRATLYLSRECVANSRSIHDLVHPKLRP